MPLFSPPAMVNNNAFWLFAMVLIKLCITRILFWQDKLKARNSSR